MTTTPDAAPSPDDRSAAPADAAESAPRRISIGTQRDGG